jgi:hypothetical protein
VFFEVCKQIFNLRLSPGQFFSTSTSVQSAATYRLSKRKRSPGAFAKDMDADISSVFFLKSPPVHPINWQEVNGDDTTEFLQEVCNMLNANVDKASITIYKVDITADLQGNKGHGVLPLGSVLVRGNFALFYLDPDTQKYRLDFIVIGRSPDSIKALNTVKMGVWEYYNTCVARGVMCTNAKTRTQFNQKMVITGFRWAGQTNKHGETFGIRCDAGEVLVADQAMGAVVMSQVISTLLNPVLGGGVNLMADKVSAYRHTITPTSAPFTVQSITKDYQNSSHVDLHDLWGSFVIWLEAGDGEIEEGSGCFACTTHGFHVSPEDGMCAWIRSPKVYHHTLPVKSKGDCCRLGIALAANKNVLSGVANQTSNLLEAVGAGQILTSYQDISPEFKKIEAFKRLLEKDELENPRGPAPKPLKESKRNFELLGNFSKFPAKEALGEEENLSETHN